MKPLLLKFAAFGPYVDEQIIDFKELSSSGLFLIHGETGSGKTVILDAITYALYGESSGGIRGAITSMRCQLASESVETYVEYTFEVQSGIYTFARRLRMTKHRNGEVDFSPAQTVLVHHEDGRREPLFENPKIKTVNDEAKRLIGLDYEQFRQIIILPQGQFEKLLVAESGDKEQILSTLFGAQKWDEVSAYLSERARGSKAELTVLKSRMEHICEDTGCADIAEMAQLCEKLQTEAEQLEEEKKSAEKTLAEATKEYDKVKALFDEYSRHKKLTAELAELQSRDEEFVVKEALLKRCKNARSIKSVYDIFVAAQKMDKQRKTAADTAKTALDTLQAKLNFAQEKSDSFEAMADEISAFEKEQISLENMRIVYENLDSAKSAAEKAKKESDKMNSGLALAEKKYADSGEKRAELEEKQAALYAEYVQMFHSSGVAGMLASELEDGTPCPVCGSCIHPKKAEYSDDFSSAKLAAKQDEIDDVTDRVKKAQKNHAELAVALEDARSSAKAADEEYLKCTAQYDALLANVSDEFDSLADLCKQIDDIAMKVNTYKSDYEAAKKELDEARTSMSAAVAKLESAEAEYGNAKKQLEKAEQDFAASLKRYGFDTAEEFEECMIDDERVAQLESEINTYRENIAALKKSISLMNDVPHECPDIDEAADVRDALSNEMSDISGRLAVALDELERRRTQQKNLAELEEKYNTDHIAYAGLATFAEAVAGSKGISLKRYILGVMLSAVTAQANRMLANVHGGRYRLHHRDDTNSKAKKLGLGLEVYDSYSGKYRDVSTLSGGEKFLVSLALSIGLSGQAQMQSGGIRTDAMFIDEGFGTLDSGSVADALDILAGLREGSSVIGIISHIPALRESITSCIEVKKDRTGSNINVYI